MTPGEAQILAEQLWRIGKAIWFCVGLIEAVVMLTLLYLFIGKVYRRWKGRRR